MGEAGYNVIVFFLRAVPIYIPVFYIAWIYMIGYTHSELLSNSNMRKSLYATSILAILITLAQMQEFNIFFQETLSLEKFLELYLTKCLFHPFFIALLILLLLYIRNNILKVRMYTFLLGNGFLVVVSLLPAARHTLVLVSTLLKASGILLDGVNYVFLVLVGLLLMLCFTERFGKVFSTRFKKKNNKRRKKAKRHKNN